MRVSNGLIPVEASTTRGGEEAPLTTRMNGARSIVRSRCGTRFQEQEQRNPVTTRFARAADVLTVVAVLAFAFSAGCGSPSAPTPTRPSQPASGTPAAGAGVHVQGQVVNADNGEPVAAAAVTIVQIEVPGRFYTPTGMPTATTDEAGTFAFTALLPAAWGSVRLGVTRDGFEKAGAYVKTDQIAAAVVRVFPTLRLRPGEPLELRWQPLGHYVCGWESYWCRRIAVEAVAGESLEVELTPMDGQGDVGLVPQEEPYPFTGYQHRVAVSNGAVWIIGGPAKVLLTATRR